MFLKCQAVLTNGWKEVQKSIGADFKIKLNTLHPVVKILCHHGHHMGHRNWRICCTWDTLLYLLLKFHFFIDSRKSKFRSRKFYETIVTLVIFLCCADNQFGNQNGYSRCSNISLLQVQFISFHFVTRNWKFNFGTKVGEWKIQWKIFRGLWIENSRQEVSIWEWRSWKTGGNTLQNLGRNNSIKI